MSTCTTRCAFARISQKPKRLLGICPTGQVLVGADVQLLATGIQRTLLPLAASRPPQTYLRFENGPSPIAMNHLAAPVQHAE